MAKGAKWNKQMAYATGKLSQHSTLNPAILVSLSWVCHLFLSPSTTYLLLNIRAMWWFQIFFMFTPKLGKSPILTDIFKMGWNHQRGRCLAVFALFIYQKHPGWIHEVDPEIHEVDPKIPEVDPKIPEVDPKIPEVDPKIPEVDPEIPEVDPEIPEVDLEILEVDPEIPEVDLESSRDPWSWSRDPWSWSRDPWSWFWNSKSFTSPWDCRIPIWKKTPSKGLNRTAKVSNYGLRYLCKKRAEGIQTLQNALLFLCSFSNWGQT